MAVLNGALAPRMVELRPEQRGLLPIDNWGFAVIDANNLYGLACGFSLEPADVMESVIQGSSAAWDAIQKPKSGR